MEATILITTGDHLFGEVTIEDTDAAATRTGNEWQGTAIWTDGSRLEDGSVCCAVARHHPEHNAWTGARVHMGRNQEVYGAELHAICRAMLTLFKNPVARRSPSSQTPRQPYRGLHPTYQAQDSDNVVAQEANQT